VELGERGLGTGSVNTAQKGGVGHGGERSSQKGAEHKEEPAGKKSGKKKSKKRRKGPKSSTGTIKRRRGKKRNGHGLVGDGGIKNIWHSEVGKRIGQAITREGSSR